ncbi:MAG: alpha-L-fucosidase, partial [Anaerolineae bacterium]
MQGKIFEAAHVCPSARQLAWQKLELMAFFHFTVNTFTDQEWGDGTEDPRVFNPTQLDPSQWLCIARNAGIKLAILTAKHHDGFCLWPSRYTEHSVKHSPYKNGHGDVVREFVEACRAFDVRVGLYLSPWDRHEATYGSDAYNDYFNHQLTELLTGYGPIAEVWFDGACGEGPNGKRQVYDWERYYRVIRSLQPEAVIAISGPDVRWVGNEDGVAREDEWSVVPASTLDQDKLAADSQHQEAVRPDIGDARALDLGSRARILEAERLVWYPAECDVSIRPGWFYHAFQDEYVKTPEMLVDLYFKSVGRNAALLLNLPPDPRGLIHEKDVQHLEGMRRILDATFAHNLADGAGVTASHAKDGFMAQATLDGDPDTYWTTGDGQETAVLEYDLGAEKTFNVVLLQEHIAVGQRIERFVIEAHTSGGWSPVAQGGTVGYKRLLRCEDT